MAFFELKKIWKERNWGFGRWWTKMRHIANGKCCWINQQFANCHIHFCRSHDKMILVILKFIALCKHLSHAMGLGFSWHGHFNSRNMCDMEIATRYGPLIEICTWDANAHNQRLWIIKVNILHRAPMLQKMSHSTCTVPLVFVAVVTNSLLSFYF